MQNKTQQQLDDEAAEAKKKRAGPKRRKVTHGRSSLSSFLDLTDAGSFKAKIRMN